MSDAPDALLLTLSVVSRPAAPAGAGRPGVFTDPCLCAVVVDRLTFNGTIIETGTDSYRLASTRARAEHAEAG